MRVRHKMGLCLVVGVAVVVAATTVQCLRHLAITRTMGNRNLTGIYIAILNYEHDYNSLPPACGVSRSGKRMHSWRVLLLPYLGESDLYAQYEFSLPWNSTENHKLTVCEPAYYRPPQDSDEKADVTSYVVVNDPKGLWPGSKSQQLAADGSDMDKVLLLEITHSDIEWTEPRDLTLREALRLIEPDRDQSPKDPRVVAYMTVAGEICVLNNDGDRELLCKRLEGR